MSKARMLLALAAATTLLACQDPALRHVELAAEVEVDRTTGVWADGVDAAEVVVRVRNMRARPMVGWRVRVEAADAVFEGAETTDADGVARGLLRADSPGARTLTVTVDDGSGEITLDDHPTVEFVRPPGGSLVFRTQPRTTTAGKTFDAVEVVALDVYGAPVEELPSVTVELEGDASGTVLGGEKRSEGRAGVAVFDALFIERAGDGYRLRATASGLSSAGSDPFAILPGPPDALRSRVRVSDSPQPADGQKAITIEAQLRDAFDNPTPNIDVSFTLEPPDASDAFSTAARSNALGETTARVRSTRAGTRNVVATAGTVELDDRPAAVFLPGGMVSGIAEGVRAPGLTIRLETAGATETLSVEASGAFEFASTFFERTEWRVVVEHQPENQACIVERGEGVVDGASAGGVRVRCGLRWRMTAEGEYSSLGLTVDGRLWSWGYNHSGQQGDGTTTPRLAPFEPMPDETFKSIAVGSEHALAVRLSDGSVWAAGNNDVGQLGDGTNTSRSRFVRVGGEAFADITKVSAGFKHSLALKSDGTLWAWGMNRQGRLGDGSTDDRNLPVRAAGADDMRFVDVVAGLTHSVALRDDGTLWAWGASTGVDNHPRQIGAGTDYVAVGAGQTTTFAIRQDGSLWGLGQNAYGQLGDGTTEQRMQLVRLGAPDVEFVQVAGGIWHTFALSTDGTLWAWGQGGTGILGLGPNATSHLFPTPVGGGFSHVATNTSRASAVKTDTTLWTWGVGEAHRADGTSVNFNPAKPLLEGISAVSAGMTGTYALATDGRLWGTGPYARNESGEAAPHDHWHPMGEGFTSVAAGVRHALAQKKDGSVWGWGSNGDGELARPASSEVVFSSPIALESVVGPVVERVFAAPSMRGLPGASFALGAGGTLFGWGRGTASGSDPWTPTRVGDGYRSVSVAEHVVALKTDGTVWTWGGNGHGELGDGTSTPRSEPAQVAVAGVFVEVGAGDGFTLALRDDGELWGWGRSPLGQLAGLANPTLVPSALPDIDRVVSFAVGRHHVVAIDEDGHLWGWGDNACGTLSPGDARMHATPVRLPLQGRFKAVSAAQDHSVALGEDGVLWGWGCNGLGQLGTARDDRSPAFVPCTD